MNPDFCHQIYSIVARVAVCQWHWQRGCHSANSNTTLTQLSSLLQQQQHSCNSHATHMQLKCCSSHSNDMPLPQSPQWPPKPSCQVSLCYTPLPWAAVFDIQVANTEISPARDLNVDPKWCLLDLCAVAPEALSMWMRNLNETVWFLFDAFTQGAQPGCFVFVLGVPEISQVSQKSAKTIPFASSAVYKIIGCHRSERNKQKLHFLSLLKASLSRSKTPQQFQFEPVLMLMQLNPSKPTFCLLICSDLGKIDWSSSLWLAPNGLHDSTEDLLYIEKWIFLIFDCLLGNSTKWFRLQWWFAGSDKLSLPLKLIWADFKYSNVWCLHTPSIFMVTNQSKLWKVLRGIYLLFYIKKNQRKIPLFFCLLWKSP